MCLDQLEQLTDCLIHKRQPRNLQILKINKTTRHFFLFCVPLLTRMKWFCYNFHLLLFPSRMRQPCDPHNVSYNFSPIYSIFFVRTRTNKIWHPTNHFWVGQDKLFVARPRNWKCNFRRFIIKILYCTRRGRPLMDAKQTDTEIATRLCKKPFLCMCEEVRAF